MIVVGSTACDRHVGCIIYSSLVAMELVCLVPALTRGKLCAAILFRYTSSQLGVRRRKISRRGPHHAPELVKTIQDRTIWNGIRRDGTTCDEALVTKPFAMSLPYRESVCHQPFLYARRKCYKDYQSLLVQQFYFTSCCLVRLRWFEESSCHI